MEELDKPAHWSDKERQFVLPKRTRFNTALLPVLQNLVSVGMTEADIGAIVGYQGENSADWLNNLKKNHPEVKEACAIGKRIADSFLVAQMYRTAVGYDYVEQEYKKNKEGEMELWKESIKHQPPNATMAMFLAINHMPDQYKHRIETTKKSFIIDASGELSSDQIEKLAGKLLEESNRVKFVESTEIIETSFEPVETENGSE